MKAFRTKLIYLKVQLHYHNFIFFERKKKQKNFDFERYFHMSERGSAGVHFILFHAT